MNLFCGFISVLAFIVLGLFLIGCLILLGFKLLRGGFSNNERHRHNEETRVIQDVYKGLSKMEERVEALETLLMDQERKGNKSWEDFKQ